MASSSAPARTRGERAWARVRDAAQSMAEAVENGDPTTPARAVLAAALWRAEGSDAGFSTAAFVAAANRGGAALVDPAWCSAPRWEASLAALVQAYAALPGEPPPSALLERLHDAAPGSRSRSRRHAHGAYFTSEPMARALVHTGLEDAPADACVLDPACGGGVFLVQALEALHARSPATPVAVLARTQLSGVDRDPLAVSLARALLARAVLHLGGGDVDLSHTVVCADALAEDTVFDWRAAFPHVAARGGFDLVAGNPPYVSYAGRHAEPLPDAVRQAYRLRFVTGAWPCTHAFFVERAVGEWSRGRVAFVLPAQITHLAEYGPLRAFVTARARLVQVQDFGEDVFEDATTPVVTLCTDRTSPGPTRFVDAHGTEVRHAVSQGEGPWTPPSPFAGRISQMTENAFGLGDSVVDCGIRTTDAAGQVVTLTDLPQPGVLPVLEGRCVGRYRCDPPVRGVRTGGHAPLHMRPEATFDAVRFVIRQTAAYPVVGPRRHSQWFRNSLLGLRDVPGMDLRWVVALLNSTLLRAVYVERTTEARQKTFPQVKIAALRGLPLRHPVSLPPGACDTACRMVDALLLDPADERTDRALDDWLFTLHGIPEDERARLRARLASLPPPP